MRIEKDLYKALSPYIIEAALPMVLQRLTSRSIRLNFSDKTGRVLGWYRGEISNRGGRMSPLSVRGAVARVEQKETISIQIRMNPYALLLVFIHEWAHLLTHRDFPGATSHGKEWKGLYRQEACHFLRSDIFPPDLLSALHDYFKKPGACFDERLTAACLPYGQDRKAFEKIYAKGVKCGIWLPAPVTYRMKYEKTAAPALTSATSSALTSAEPPVAPASTSASAPSPVRPLPPSNNPVRMAAAGGLKLPARVKIQDRAAYLKVKQGSYITGTWEDTGKPMRVYAPTEVGVIEEADAHAPSEAAPSAFV